MQCENKLIIQIDKIMYFDFFIDDYFFLKKKFKFLLKQGRD